MQKGDSLSFRADARNFVDQADSGATAALQRVVKVIDGKANVVNTRAAPGHEPRDWRLRIIRLEQLHQRLPGSESHYFRPVGVVQLDFLQPEHIPEKGNGF